MKDTRFLGIQLVVLLTLGFLSSELSANSIPAYQAKSRLQSFIRTYVKRNKVDLPAGKLEDYLNQASQLIQQDARADKFDKQRLSFIENDFRAFIRAEYPTRRKSVHMSTYKKPYHKATKPNKRKKTARKPKTKSKMKPKMKSNKRKKTTYKSKTKSKIKPKIKPKTKKYTPKKTYKQYKVARKQMAGWITISYAEIKARRKISKAGIARNKRGKIFNSIMRRVRAQARKGRISRKALKAIAEQELKAHKMSRASK